MSKHQRPDQTQTPADGCQSHTTAFFASLAGPPVVAAVVAPMLWLSTPPVFDFLFARFTSWEQRQTVALVPPRHLKPKIPDLRVYIQSLTI